MKTKICRNCGGTYRVRQGLCKRCRASRANCTRRRSTTRRSNPRTIGRGSPGARSPDGLDVSALVASCTDEGRDVSIEKETVRTLAKRPVVVVEPDATLRQVAETLADDYIGVAVVRATPPPGPGTRAEGVISERDIVRALAEGANPDIERVENVMTLDIETAAPADTIVSVAERMLDDEIRHVPVVDDGMVVGVVSERDALRISSRSTSPHGNRDDDHTRLGTDRVVQRARQGLGSARGREGRQPRRADGRGLPGSAGVRRHRARVPPGDGRSRRARGARGPEPPASSPDAGGAGGRRRRLQELVHKAGIPTALAARDPRGVRRSSGDEPFVAVRSSATARGHREHVVRGNERDVHERHGRRRTARPRRRLLGVALRRARRVTYRRSRRHHRRAGDRGGRPTNGRRPNARA